MPWGSAPPHPTPSPPAARPAPFCLTLVPFSPYSPAPVPAPSLTIPPCPKLARPDFHSSCHALPRPIPPCPPTSARHASRPTSPRPFPPDARPTQRSPLPATPLSRPPLCPPRPTHPSSSLVPTCSPLTLARPLPTVEFTDPFWYPFWYFLGTGTANCV